MSDLTRSTMVESQLRAGRAWRRVTAVSLLLVLVAATLVLGGVGADAAEDEAPTLGAEGLGGYTSEGTGAPLSFLVFEPVTPVPADPGKPHLQAEFAYVFTDLSTGPQGRALSSALWPGPLLGDGFPAIAGLIAGEEAPDYPIKTDARSPGQQPEVCTEPVPGTGMCSFAEGFEVRATARSVDSPAPDAIVVGAFESESYGRAADGRAVTTTVVTAQDVSLLGGIIGIDAVRTVVETSSDGSVGASAGSTTVQGLTIADQAFLVDEDGIRPAEGDSLTGPFPELPGREDLIEALGIDIRVLPHEETLDGARAIRSAGGLQITLDMSVLREQLDTTAIEELLKQLPPIEDPGLPEELTDQLPVKIFQEPYLTLLPAFLLAPELVVIVGGASSETAASEPMSLDFDLPAIPPPATPPATTSAPAGSTSTPTPPSTTTSVPVNLPDPTGPSTGTGAISTPPPAAPEVAGPADPSVTPVASGAPVDAPFEGIAPVLGMVGLLGVAAGSWGMRATSAALFGAAGACPSGNDDGLPDLKGA